MSISVTDNINSFNVSHVSIHNTIADDRSGILMWLSSLEPRARHQVRSHRADNVGEWLLQPDEFQSWCGGTQHEGFDQATLLCCGDPGVGKTYFCSLVVDELCDMARERNIAVSCFYVDFAARKEQSPTNILGSLLKQIVGGLEKIPEEISQTFQEHKKMIGGRGLRVAEIVKMLQTVTSLQPTFICVDALDECVERHRPEILDSLRQILEKSPNTRIFLTGRQHVRGEISRNLGERVTVLSIQLNSDDIMRYIRMRLSKDTDLYRMDSGLEGEIIKSITENIPSTFLLIYLTMDAILGQTTAYGRRRKLRAMTESLDLRDVYGATLERIKEQGGEKKRLGMEALMWISHSERLLQLDELLHALAVEIGSTDLNADSVPSEETLLSCCLGLVVVDREASTVRLIHFTLQEYLSTCSDLFGPIHSIMAETCLTYLNHRTIKNISSRLLVLPQSTPFLKYSSLYWGVHAKREASEDVVSLALQLFSQIESHISTRLLLEDLKWRADLYYHHISTNSPLVGFTGLHCASIFGIAEIATFLIDQPNYDLNKRDFLGITPLIWSAICGQEGVAKLLLEWQTIIPDKLDRLPGRTALSWAAVMGHEGIVRLLLERGSANPDGTDGWWGKTPRFVNMVRGRRYVSPNRPSEHRRTPILLAAKEGHEGVIKLLLERKDVKPHLPDSRGLTPLSWAAKNGHDGAVELLLGRQDVKPGVPDGYGQTPLWWAASHGHDGTVKVLLGQENINPDMPGDNGRTPLSGAAMCGRDEVVKLLLGRKEVNPDRPDIGGRTPLSWAAKCGFDVVVEILLEQEGVNPNMPDNYGRTPLSLAAAWGRDGVVKLLLEREAVNPDMLDKGGRTPLSSAAAWGRDGVVKQLLEREGVNPDMLDKGGRTPLLRAAKQGRDGVVKLLLGREGVNPNVPDNGGRTPLSWAAEQGYDGVVELLLGRESINPNMPDKRGQTPMSWAAKKGHDGVVRLLLEREDVPPDMLNKGQTPQSLASKKRHDGAVKPL